MAVFKFLWLAIRPASKLESAVGWWDVLNLLVLIAYPTVGGIVPISQLFKEAPATWWFGVPALLLLIAGWKLQNKLNGFESKTPRIVFQRGDVATGALYAQHKVVPLDEDIDRTQMISPTVHFVYVFLKNDPTGYRGEERTAKKLVAAFDIYALDNLKSPLMGFWGKPRDTIQVTRRPTDMPFQDLAEFDLPPNGLPHRIDFALKHDSDADMYGYNDEAQRYSKDGRYAPLILPKHFLTKVRVKAVGLDKETSSWYRVDNGGKGIKPTITQLTEGEIRRLPKSKPDKEGSQT